MSKLSKEALEFKKNFEAKIGDYERLRTAVFGVISPAIKGISPSTLPIQSRTKDSASAATKFERKGYLNGLDSLTDAVGFRIVVYLESQIDEVERILRALFEVDEKNSIDKRRPKTLDAVGYRPLHLICKLGPVRKELPEYNEICELAFEIQIRTILEHTWAEIEHKQNYKSEVALPTSLQRRLYVIAGALELLDREISAIANDAEAYKQRIQNDASIYADDSLSIASAETVITKKLSQFDFTPRSLKMDTSAIWQDIIRELENFGVESISDLEDLLESKYLLNIIETDLENTIFGVIRDLMVISEPQKFMTNCFKGQFGFEEADIERYREIRPEIPFFQILDTGDSIVRPDQTDEIFGR